MNRKLSNEELNRLSLEDYRVKEKVPLIVILDDVRSLSNVGSVFRTCDAFGVKELVLCGITGTPPHREIQKTALGATESVDWSHETSIDDAVKRLKAEGYVIIAVEQSVRSITPQQLTDFAKSKIALVLGNEVTGVTQSVVDLSDQVVEIPQEGTKHSLNVSVAAGIVIWEAYKAITRN
ncbi:MAG: RNA methyltransferase [Flavobacteriales bacterium]